jgi:restriction system protein
MPGEKQRPNFIFIHARGIRIISIRTTEGGDIVDEINIHVNNYETQRKQTAQLEMAQIQGRQLDKISPIGFEKLIDEIFTAMGYTVKRTKITGDQEVDLLCTGKEREIVVVQCKRYQAKVSSSIVRDFYGTILHEKASRGYLVTTGRFSSPAIDWAKGKPIELVDRDKLAFMLERFLPN